MDRIIYNDDLQTLQEMADAYIFELNSFVFLEGAIMDEATGKGKNESVIIKIIKFLPRLISAIVKMIRQKLLDRDTDKKLAAIRQHSSDIKQESFVQEASVKVAFWTPEVKTLHKYSDEFNSCTGKIYEDSQQMGDAFKSLMMISDSNKSITHQYWDFHNHHKTTQIYHRFMDAVDKWARRFNKIHFKDDTVNNINLNSALVNDELISATSGGMTPIEAADYVDHIRSNMKDASQNLDKSSNILRNTEVLNTFSVNKLAEELVIYLKDMVHSCKCLSVIANKIIECTRNIIDDIYEKITSEIREVNSERERQNIANRDKMEKQDRDMNQYEKRLLYRKIDRDTEQYEKYLQKKKIDKINKDTKTLMDKFEKMNKAREEMK